MPTKKQTIVAEFSMLKETKNTIRFEETVEPAGAAVIGNLYLQKHALPTLGEGVPGGIKVTIERLS